MNVVLPQKSQSRQTPVMRSFPDSENVVATEKRLSKWERSESFPQEMAYNGLALGEVVNSGTDYFLLKIKFLAKRKRDFSEKLAISPNACYAVVS